MTRDQALAKVRKLMALGTNAGATEHERERAMAQAHAMLARFNLEMSELDQEDNDRNEEVVTFYQSPATRKMARAVGELFFCRYLYYKGTKRHLFIGNHANSVTAAEMAKWLFNSINREMTRLGLAGSTRTSFLYGAAETIAQRCHTLRVEAERASQAEAQPGTSLVLASVYQREAEKNNEYFAQKYGQARTTKARVFNRLDANAFYQGADYGNKVNFHRQVGTTNSNATRLK